MNATPESPRRVAILKPCCIGDCIMALPAIDAMASAWESAEIDIFVGAHSRAAFAFRPAMTRRSVADQLDIASAMNTSRILRQRRYDAVAILDRSRWLRLAAHTSRAAITASVESMSPEMRHESEVYLDVVRSLDIATAAVLPSIAPSAESQREADRILHSMPEPFAVIHPGGARNPGADALDKRWPADRFVGLAKALRADGVEVLVSGGPDEVNLARHVAESASLAERAILAGRASLEVMAAVLHGSAAFVGPDTGMSHIAAAVGTPTVAIFGPTNPRRYRPLGREVQVLAPAESWRIQDRDLRHPKKQSDTISTGAVSLQDVLGATRRALNRSRERGTCGA